MSYFVCNVIIEDENDYDLESLFNTSSEVYLKKKIIIWKPCTKYVKTQ
jgi:hypothetical protein